MLKLSLQPAWVEVQVSAGAFETAGLRGEDKMEDRCFILSPLQGPAPDTHLIGEALRRPSFRAGLLSCHGVCLPQT